MASHMGSVKAIFSINAGRSGSEYLAKILDGAKNCVSHHEKRPAGFGASLQAFNRGKMGPMSDVARIKASAIKQANAKGLIYIETNHCFVKGFGWPLMDAVAQEDIGIIILRRNPTKIAESMLRIRSVPLNRVGPYFNLTPNRKNPAVPPPPFLGLPGGIGYRAARFLSLSWRALRRLFNLASTAEQPEPFLKYQRAVTDWYIEETDALGREFRRRHPGCQYFEVELDELNSREGVQRLCDFFGIDMDAAQVKIIGIPLNTKL